MLPGPLKKLKRQIAKILYNRDRHFTNLEGEQAFKFKLTGSKKPVGSSAILRAKNEELFIGGAIRSIYNAFDEIVVIDNGSTDSTYEIVESLKNEIDHDGRIKLLRYPFAIARCGNDHTNTDESSVHSLVYYYNWCLSHATYNYVLKWDADMYLKSGDSLAQMRDYVAQIQNEESMCVIPIQTVYISPSGQFYEALDDVNREFTLFPNRPYIRFKKAELWEALIPDFYIPKVVYPGVDIYELKDTNSDEFSHWTTTEFTTPRKKREWVNYNAVKNGELSDNFRFIEPLF